MKGYYGAGLYHYRSLRKINQKSLASWLGMSRQNLSKIERDKCKISEEHLAIAAQKLQTTVRHIKNFDKNGEPLPNAEDLAPLVEQPDDALVKVPASLIHSLIAAFQAMQQEYVLFLDREAQREREREKSSHHRADAKIGRAATRLQLRRAIL